MNVKIPDLWANVLGASLVLLASSTFFHGFKPLSLAKEGVKTAQQPAPAAVENNFSYVAASAPDSTTNASTPTTTNSGLPPCPTPDQKGTGVLIEGDRPGETTGRKEKIEAVVQQNRLAGKWCTSAKTRNATWNMDGVSVDEALRAFNLFKSAGLVALAHPTNSPTAGKITWQRTGAGGNDQGVSALPQINSNMPENSALQEGPSGSAEPRSRGEMSDREAPTAPRYSRNSRF
jgi:hypothetical protein